MGECVGLDFGTTYSILSRLSNTTHDQTGKISSYVLEDYKPDHQTSCQDTLVLKRERGPMSFGLTARTSLLEDGLDGATIFRGFKMLLGEDDKKKLAARGYEGENSPAEITREYIQRLVKEYCRDATLDKIVVGVPQVWFDNLRSNESRTVLKSIIQETGLAKSVELVSEPAAACAYYVDRYKLAHNGEAFQGHIVIVDYGGGTLDVALCKVSKANSTGSGIEVRVIDSCGAGDNAEESKELGKAGLAFMERIVQLVLEKQGETNVDSVKVAQLSLNLENQLKAQKTLIADAFQSIESGDPGMLDMGFKFDRGTYFVSYRIIEQAYDEVIREVLSTQLRRIKESMRNAGVDPDACGGFKVVPIGGFCNFYKTIQQIKQEFNISTADVRFDAIISEDSERAVSFGATLIANGILSFKNVAPYHFGVMVNDFGLETHKPKPPARYTPSQKAKMYEKIRSTPENVLFAVKKGSDLVDDEIYFIENEGERDIFWGSKLPLLAFSTEDKPYSKGSIISPGVPLDEYRKQWELGQLYRYHIGFSFDKSMNITLHFLIYDAGDTKCTKPIEVKAIPMRSLSAMYGNRPL